MEDCADDAVAVCDVLGIDKFIPVGYSMGGPIAQLIWQRHRPRVAGWCSAQRRRISRSSRQERLSFLGISGLAALARLTPVQARQWLTDQFYLQRKTEQWEPWALHEAARHDWRAVLEAGRALGNFSSRDWINEVDVPTSTLITMRDRVVPVRRQIRLFEAIPDAEAFRVDGDHDAVVANAKQFVPTLLRACRSVVERRDEEAAPASAWPAS